MEEWGDENFDTLQKMVFQSYQEDQRKSAKWKEFYCLLHIKDQVLGFVFVCLNLETQWCFAYKFGILKEVRGYGISAIDFLRDIQYKTSFRVETYGREFTLNDFKGIMLEINSIDFRLLEHAYDRYRDGGQILGHSDELEIIDSLKNFLRLKLYQTWRGYAVLQGDEHKPLHFWYPSNKEDLDHANDIEIITIVCPFELEDINQIDLEEILYFSYDKVCIENEYLYYQNLKSGYTEYLLSLKEKVRIEAREKGWKLGKLNSKVCKKVLQVVHKEEQAKGLGSLLTLDSN